MVKIISDDKFKNVFSKIKENLLKQRIIKQIEKIKLNLKMGKLMKNIRKGTRELYINPFRLSYRYIIEKETVEILELCQKCICENHILQDVDEAFLSILKS